MKIVLVTLSGDSAIGHAALLSHYPAAVVVDIERIVLETGSQLDRLRSVRSMRPDVFAIMTESLEWQYGQDALMLFGALAGSDESVIVDARGRVRRHSRIELLAKAPAWIGSSFLRGKRSVQQALAALGRLEKEVEKRPAFPWDRRGEQERLSIAYLRATPAAGTQPGGATSHINGVINGLLSFGANIDLISNDEIAGIDKSKVDLHFIRPYSAVLPRSAFDIHNGMAFSRSAAKLIAASRPDLIYQRYCRFSWAGVEASLTVNVPLFLEYNGSEVWIGKNWDRTEKLELLERCERLNLAAATMIFVISEVEKNNLLAAGVAADKIIVNPNGVDADKFRPGIGGHEERAKLGLSDETALVGFVGSFGPWHGVLVLADAVALTPKNAKIHFLLIGDGSLRPEVENKLRASGDLDRVTFTGVVKHDRVPAMLDACDILVSPHVPLADGSEFFGSPTKLFEYMAMGKGIVASRLGQIGDVLTDNETALLVEPGKVKELSDAIQELAGDPALLSRLGDAARAAAVAKHTWRQNAATVLETFENGGLDQYTA